MLQDVNPLDHIERKSILVVIVFILTLHACTLSNPKAVVDFAISALCDFPPSSGNNMCQKVEIVRFMEEDSSKLISINDDHPKCWCVELEYIDYTGESGFASLWIIESSNEGGYILYKGPIFDADCEKSY